MIPQQLIWWGKECRGSRNFHNRSVRSSSSETLFVVRRRGLVRLRSGCTASWWKTISVWLERSHAIRLSSERKSRCSSCLFSLPGFCENDLDLWIDLWPWPLSSVSCLLLFISVVVLNLSIGWSIWSTSSSEPPTYSSWLFFMSLSLYAVHYMYICVYNLGHARIYITICICVYSHRHICV